MTDRNDTISPRARRQPAGDAAVELPSTASGGARVLVRVPMVAPSTKKPATNSRVQEPEVRSPGPSAVPTAPLPAIRIDAAHDEISGPHSAAPEWTDRRAGRFARIAQGKAVVAVALIVGIAIVAAVQLRSAGTTTATKEDTKVSATRSERKQHRAARGGGKVEDNGERGARASIESSPELSSSEVPGAAVSNSPATIGQASPGSGASAAANEPAQEGGSDFFRLYDSPAGAVPSSETGAGGDARPGLRMALRDVPAEGAPAATVPGTAASKARLGGMLGKLPVLNSQ